MTKKVRELSPARKGGLMYLSIDFVQELVDTLDEVIPEKVLKKEKTLALLVNSLRACVETHKEDIRTGKGIVIGRDIQEVRHVVEYVPVEGKPKPKAKSVKYSKTRKPRRRRTR